MPKRNWVIVAVVVFLTVFIYHSAQMKEPSETLFNEEEIEASNIEQIQLLEVKSNKSEAINDAVRIKEIALFLKSVNVENPGEIHDPDAQFEYLMYIVNNGRYPSSPIGIQKNSISWKTKEEILTPEQSALLFKLINK